MEVVLENGSISNDTQSVLEKWKRDFSSLLNVQHCTESASNNGNSHQNPCQTDIDPMFNAHISVMEVKKAVDSAKRGKACGIDGIPTEVLRNVPSVSFLHIIFNICFEKGTVPSLWSKCIISPIPKSSTTDPRNPLSYRGIALASSMYKL